MPRKYVRKAGVVPNATWSQSNLEAALKAMAEKKHPVRVISRRYGIPMRTLQRRFAKNDSTKNCLGKHPVLDFDNEQHLEAVILKLEQGGISLSRDMIRRVAFEFADQLGLNVPFNRETRCAGSAWLTSFLERHPQVTVKNKKELPKGKQDNYEKELLDSITNALEEQIKEHQKDPKPEELTTAKEELTTVKEELTTVKEELTTIKEELTTAKEEDSNSGDPLVFKTEPMDDHSTDTFTEDFVEFNEANIKTSSKEYLAAKRRRMDSEESRNDLVDVKCDGVDLLFLGYADALKKMSRKTQINVKYEIAKIINEAELSELHK